LTGRKGHGKPSPTAARVANRDVLRIVDANSNRTREALRVVEDILRLSLEDGRMAGVLKAERHRVGKYCDQILAGGGQGLKARDTAGDPGRDSMSRGEATRRDLREVLVCNFRRAEESLRVLEEVTKLVDVGIARMLKRTRFRVYNLEQTCITRMERRLARN
jgi:ThiD2 family